MCQFFFNYGQLQFYSQHAFWIKYFSHAFGKISIFKRKRLKWHIFNHFFFQWKTPFFEYLPGFRHLNPSEKRSSLQIKDLLVSEHILISSISAQLTKGAKLFDQVVPLQIYLFCKKFKAAITLSPNYIFGMKFQSGFMHFCFKTKQDSIN